MKALCLTSLTSSQDVVKDFISRTKPYGLEVTGHFWIDDLQKMAWIGPRDMLVDAKTALWGILGSKQDFEKPEIRYGLSLLALSAAAQKQSPLNILILQEGEEAITAGDLPTPLKGADVRSLSDSGLGAKLVAKIHQPQSPSAEEYFIDIHGNEHIGQWFEIRPTDGSWPGAMFGAAGGEIVFQAVGPAGGLPEKSVLNYPSQGLQLSLGDTEYTAWALQNEINPETAYYAKVDGHPSSIIFGPFSTEASADVYVMNLK